MDRIISNGAIIIGLTLLLVFLFAEKAVFLFKNSSLYESHKAKKQAAACKK